MGDGIYDVVWLDWYLVCVVDQWCGGFGMVGKQVLEQLVICCVFVLVFFYGMGYLGLFWWQELVGIG